MTDKITKKITGYKVKNTDAKKDDIQENIKKETLSIDMERPELLLGATYKIKIPQSEHATYVTINDILLNADTEYEQRVPYEVFINSKHQEHFQWLVAVTRLISLALRGGIPAKAIALTLTSIFDPKGGFMKKGNGFIPSLVAEIGNILVEHLKITNK